jgi:hypothetical protein
VGRSAPFADWLALKAVTAELVLPPDATRLQGLLYAKALAEV